MTIPDGFHRVPPGKLAMIVTYLDMRTPAPLRGASLPTDVTFAALPRDPAHYRDIFRRIGKDWLWFGRLILDDLQLCTIIENPDVLLHGLFVDGRAEGLL